jgi:hypothetical protein
MWQAIALRFPHRWRHRSHFLIVVPAVAITASVGWPRRTCAEILRAISEAIFRIVPFDRAAMTLHEPHRGDERAGNRRQFGYADFRPTLYPPPPAVTALARRPRVRLSS